MVSTGEVDIDRTTDILLLQKTESSPKVEMFNENCSTQPDDSELQNNCKGSGQDQVPISPVGKVAAFSIVYGVLFLVAVIGKWENVFRSFYKLVSKNKDERTELET